MMPSNRMTPDEIAAQKARMEKLAKRFPSLRPPKVKVVQYPAPIQWRDASLYRDLGYWVLPVERSQLDKGLERPEGAFAHGVIGDPSNPNDVTVGIGGCRLFIGNASLEDCKASWCGFVRIDVPTDKIVARELGEVVARYLPGGPIRVDAATPSLLFPFQLAPGEVAGGFDPREWTRATNGYALPTDARSDGLNRVSVCTAAECFIPNGHRYSWVDGRELLAVPRAALPTLSMAQSRGLVIECDAFLTARVAAPPTRIERMIARVTRKHA
jgi:hypothetical protein